MLYWLLGTAALMFGLYNVFIKLSADHVNAVVGAVTLQFVAAFLGLGYLLFLKATGRGPFEVTQKGICLAVLAGVSIGLVEMLTFYVFSRGVPVAVGNPLIIGGSLVVTTGGGVVLLRESLSGLQTGAIALIVLGLVLLALDAGRHPG